MHGGFHLVCIFLQIPEELKETGGSYDINKQLFQLKSLTVEVKCHKPDERVRKISDVLGSFGIPPEQIKILEPPKQIKSRCKDPWPPGSKLNVVNLYCFYVSAICLYLCLDGIKFCQIN